MIITVTLNPAIDQTIEVERFTEADTNRVASMRFDIGGKGINVARALKELGYEALAIGFAPGDLASMIEDQLADSAVGCDFVFVPGETRTNLSILDRSTHRHTVLAAQGPAVAPEYVAELRRRLARRLRPGAWLVLAGSLPPPLTADVYVDFARLAESHGARVAMDADGEVLRGVLAAGVRPALLKVNEREIARLLRVDGEIDDDWLLAELRALRASGIGHVVVTRGSAGAVAVTAEGEFRVRAPSVEVQSASGAGDCFLAGLLLAMENGSGWGAALRLAAACGSSCCTTPGTTLCRHAEVQQLRQRTVVTPLLAGTAV